MDTLTGLRKFFKRKTPKHETLIDQYYTAKMKGDFDKVRKIGNEINNKKNDKN